MLLESENASWTLLSSSCSYTFTDTSQESQAQDEPPNKESKQNKSRRRPKRETRSIGRFSSLGRAYAFVLPSEAAENSIKHCPFLAGKCTTFLLYAMRSQSSSCHTSRSLASDGVLGEQLQDVEQDGKAHTMTVFIVGCAGTHLKLLVVHSNLGFAAITTSLPTSETWEQKLFQGQTSIDRFLAPSRLEMLLKTWVSKLRNPGLNGRTRLLVSLAMRIARQDEAAMSLLCSMILPFVNELIFSI